MKGNYASLHLYNHLVGHSSCIHTLCCYTALVAEGSLFELPYQQNTEQAASERNKKT